MKSLSIAFFLPLLVFFSVPRPIIAQQSSSDIYKDIKKLGVLANVLYLAAHPDDENTRMISYLSNDLSVNTTYLSLTRGDGGQNLIGPEMRELLGVIRTEELLAARAIDGGHQLFTRANDFGYSKNPAETFTIWDRDAVLSDVVWAVRKVRPDVIINRFSSDTVRRNHGHHTASAILSEEAFSIAADRNAYPEQLKYVEPWQPERVFWNTSRFFYGSREAFEKADKSNMLGLNIGAFDPVTGESCSEIAGRSRSMHKTQSFGSAERRGESLDYLILVKDVKNANPKSLFEGIDITWNRVKGGKNIGHLVASLEQQFDFKNPSASIPQLLTIHRQIALLDDPYWKKIKLAECETLIKNCLGLYIEATTNKYMASPGSPLEVQLEIINRSPYSVSLLSLSNSTSDSTMLLSEPLLFNQEFIKDITVTTPESLSIPYWLKEAHKEGMYTVDNQIERGIPQNQPAIVITINLVIEGRSFTLTTPVVFKTVDPAKGEVTRPLYVLPPVIVGSNDDVLVFRKGEAKDISLTLTAVEDSVSGKLRLRIPEKGWHVTPEILDWSFSLSGESMTTHCTITPPENTALATLLPEVLVGSESYHHKINTLDYDHIPFLSVVREARIKLQSMDIETTPRPIAYIQGAGDDVPAALQQIGYSVDIIDPGSISASALDPYEVVIVGVRAYNTIESLAHKNKILLAWTAAGGTMIVQYNTSWDLKTSEFSPYPITLSRTRTTEENAPVTILAPEHPAMEHPNKIQPEDFDGWVQERGLYYPGEWDEHYTALLEMHDTGEESTKGALLVAPYGEGYYVYSGLSWFRHLPAGNPGPYRILSNLISLGYKSNKS